MGTTLFSIDGFGVNMAWMGDVLALPWGAARVAPLTFVGKRGRWRRLDGRGRRCAGDRSGPLSPGAQIL
jgi:hypothetical protein